MFYVKNYIKLTIHVCMYLYTDSSYRTSKQDAFDLGKYHPKIPTAKKSIQCKKLTLLKGIKLYMVVL